jgi:hypothetical protein
MHIISIRWIGLVYWKCGEWSKCKLTVVTESLSNAKTCYQLPPKTRTWTSDRFARHGQVALWKTSIITTWDRDPLSDCSGAFCNWRQRGGYMIWSEMEDSTYMNTWIPSLPEEAGERCYRRTVSFPPNNLSRRPVLSGTWLCGPVSMYLVVLFVWLRWLNQENKRLAWESGVQPTWENNDESQRSQLWQ